MSYFSMVTWVPFCSVQFIIANVKKQLLPYLVHYSVLCLVAQLCPTLCGVGHGLWPARLLCPWGFSRQEYWSGLPCPPLGDLPNSGFEPRSHTLQVDSLLSEPLGKPVHCSNTYQILWIFTYCIYVHFWDDYLRKLPITSIVLFFFLEW